MSVSLGFLSGFLVYVFVNKYNCIYAFPCFCSSSCVNQIKTCAYQPTALLLSVAYLEMYIVCKQTILEGEVA